MKKPRGIKWIALFVIGDLLLGMSCAVIYVLLKAEPEIALDEHARLKAEITKAQEEAIQHTGR